MGDGEEPKGGVHLEKLDDSLVFIEPWGLITPDVVHTIVDYIRRQTLSERFDLAVDMAKVTQIKASAAAVWPREMAPYKGRLGTAYVAGKPNAILRMMIHAASMTLGYRIEFVDDLSAVGRAGGEHDPPTR